VPVRAYVDMAGPIDFSKAGLFAKWLDPRFYDVDRVVDTVGAIPADWVKLGFKLLRPTMDVSTALNLWWNLDSPKYVEGTGPLALGQRVRPVPGGVLPAVGPRLLPAESARRKDAPARRPSRRSGPGPLPRLRGGGRRGLHRARALRQGAPRARREPGYQLSRTSRGAHLPHRRPLGLGPLLARGVGVARSPADLIPLRSSRSVARGARISSA